MALPGVRRLDHIGFTVPNLAEAEDFLVNVLGCEYMYPLGPFVHELLVISAARLLRCDQPSRRGTFLRYARPRRAATRCVA